MKAFKQINSTNRELMQVQSNAAEQFTQLRNAVIIDGVAVEGLVFTGASSLTVAHTLNRQPRGWFVTDRTTAASLHRAAWDTKNITLTASGAGTFNIWVY